MTTPRTNEREGGGGRPPFRRGGRRRRQCFCKESTVDYKDVSSIRRFITDRGRIEAGKKQGNCAKCQRNLTTAIKRARHLALLPYAPEHLRVTGSVSTTKISDEKPEEKEEAKSDEAAENTEATESTETAAVTEDAPVAEEAVEESDSSEETEAATEDVSTDEAEEAPEEEAADSSDEEDK
jgi:small subunit ribosomal protein S18